MSKRHILNHKIIEENAKWQLIKLERSTLIALVMLFLRTSHVFGHQGYVLAVLSVRFEVTGCITKVGGWAIERLRCEILGGSGGMPPPRKF